MPIELKYLLIISIMAIIIAGGILAYQYQWLAKEEMKLPEIKPPIKPPLKSPSSETEAFEIDSSLLVMEMQRFGCDQKLITLNLSLYDKILSTLKFLE